MKSHKDVNPAIICVSAYLRPHYLKRLLPALEERTRYPHRTVVVLNSPEDFEHSNNREAVNVLKHFKVTGIISDHVFTRKNGGQTGAQDAFLRYCVENYPMAEYFVFHQDDLEVPEYPAPGPCWLARQVHLLRKYPEYGAIAARIQRTPRLDWDESVDEVIPSQKSVPAVLRIHRADDIRKLGQDPFSGMGIKRWESHVCRALMEKLQLKQGFSVSTYVNHWGYIDECKGFLSDEDYQSAYSYSPERRNQHDSKPYPEIHAKTLEPLIDPDFPYDREEMRQRIKYWTETIGLQDENTSMTTRRKKAYEYLRRRKEMHEGLWGDMGCGKYKFHPDAVGIDAWPYESADMVGDVFDSWWIEDNHFDGIAASHILEHCKIPVKKALAEWKRVLKPGGHLVVIVPDAENRPGTICEPSHAHAFTLEVLKHLLGRRVTGLKLIHAGNLEGCPENKKDIVCVAQKRV